jgi:glucose-1-phosphate thymidylyltransferase
MIEHGRKILTAEVGGWYDCGKLDTLLETNEILLRKGSAKRREFPGVTIHDPVLIQDGVTVERSTVGPNVTLEAGSRVVNSRLEHVIVGEKSTIIDATLHHSMIGDRVTIRGLKGTATLGDDSEVSAG